MKSLEERNRVSYGVKEVYRIPGLPVLPFSEAEEEGKWITIRGTHVLIKDGESPSQAFKRTTGKDLSDVEKGIYDKPDSAKNLNNGNAASSSGDKPNMQKIGTHTYLPTPEETQKSISLNVETKVTQNIDDQINKLAHANGITPQEVIRQDRYSTDDARNIIANSYNQLYGDTRDEYDTLNSSDRSVLRNWRRQIKQQEPEVTKNIIDKAIANLINKYSK